MNCLWSRTCQNYLNPEGGGGCVRRKWTNETKTFSFSTLVSYHTKYKRHQNLVLHGAQPLLLSLWFTYPFNAAFYTFVKFWQVWFYVAWFSLVFYSGEMAYDISSIVNGTPNSRSIKQVFVTMSYHAAKIIYRATTLMIVNNFLYDICRPVCRYLSQGSYQYKYYYHTRLGLPLPSRRASVAVPSSYPYPVQANNPTYSVYSTYPQPHSKMMANNNNSHHPPPPPRPPRHPSAPQQRRWPRNARSNVTFQHTDGMAVRLQWHPDPAFNVFEWLV